MTSWMGGYSGTLFDRAACEKYINGIHADKLAWIKHLTLHNTGAPDMAQEDRTPGGEAQRMRNAAVGYKKKWPGGPQFWVFNSGMIGQGTPLEAGPGAVHSPSWNNISAGVEMVANFDGSVADNPKTGGGKVIFDTTAWLFAALLKKLVLPANGDTIKLHKEDPRTTHDCPGKLVKKDEFIALVRAYMSPVAKITVMPVPPPVEQYLYVDTPGDTLNFRASPGGASKGILPHQTKVLLLLYQDAWAYVQTPAGYKGYVFSKYLKDLQPTQPYLAPLPESSDTDDLVSSGNFKLSEFGFDWCKRFEGLMLTAYWDINGYAIGYGHNNGSNVPPPVSKGDRITKAEADEILARDVALQERYLNAYVSVPLKQYQIDALIWHIFQQGPGNFREGRVRPHVNAKRHEEAASAIENWPTPNAGLKRRRMVEAQRYRGGSPTRW